MHRHGYKGRKFGRERDQREALPIQAFRAVGDESFIIRNGVDIQEWFAAEAELNQVAPDHPHFFFCLYDLDLFDGGTVMRVPAAPGPGSRSSAPRTRASSCFWACHSSS